jgi:hypothetical protein
MSSKAEASAEKIVQAIADLPQTLRQAPVSQVDAELNQRLQNTLFELTHRAGDLAMRPDRTGEVIDALDRLNAAAARRQTKQTKLTASSHDALIERIDGLISVLRARATPRKRKPAKRRALKKTSKRAPGKRRAKARSVGKHTQSKVRKSAARKPRQRTAPAKRTTGRKPQTAVGTKSRHRSTAMKKSHSTHRKGHSRERAHR